MEKRIAFYGGTFDPVHSGHMEVASAVTNLFGLDDFVFVPAFHAPHKKRNKPTSAFHRFAMLCEASDSISGTRVSTIEVEQPSKPYTIETIERLKEKYPADRLYMVIGADSWEEITTWREWERVLTEVDVVVITRPGYEIGLDHVTDEIRERIIDLRGESSGDPFDSKRSVFITDAVNINISATEIRRSIGNGESDWREAVSKDVAGHIDKYDLYS